MTNPPRDACSLHSGIQYLQNALVAIQNETANSQNYTLLFRYLHNAQIQKMQQSYNDAHAKVLSEQLSDCDPSTSAQPKKDTKEGEYGDDSFTYPLIDVPQNLSQFNSQHKS